MKGRIFKHGYGLMVGLLLHLLAVTSVRAQPLLQTGVSPLETPPTPGAATLAITNIEPRAMLNTSGGTLSLYGSGFTAQSVARLVGYGMLPTTVVNATALTAQMPAGVPAGVYALEVSDGVTLFRLDNALTITAPTPTPAPTAAPQPPPPGRPILTISNYSVEPARVRAGQEFVVSIAIYNNGSRAGENTMVVFPGTTFLPVGQPGHQLGQVHINHTVVVTQKLRAPASLSSGVQQIHVSLSANDWEGNHYDYAQTVPVEVTGVAPVTGQPKVTIEGATTDPPVLLPGAPFTLTLRLANRGSRTARNVFARCTSAAAIPALGSDAVSTPQIAIEDVVTVTLPLLLDAAAPGGRQRLDLFLAYEDPGGGAYTNQETIGIDVNAGLTFQPQVLIGGYHTAPDFVQPGDPFTLTVEIANVGGGDAERLILALGGENGAALEPFSPLQAGNVIFVERLSGGATATVQWRILADGAAQAKAYNLPLALAYDDAQGGRHSDTQRLSLLVRRRPELQAIFYREPGELSAGAPTAVSLEVLNVGSRAVNVTRLEATGDRLDIQAEGTPFMGPVESGGAAPLDVTITPRETGPAEIVIRVTYRDDFNQSQTLTTTLTVNVAGGPDIPPLSSPPPGRTEGGKQPALTFWQRAVQILKGFLGFGS